VTTVRFPDGVPNRWYAFTVTLSEIGWGLGVGLGLPAAAVVNAVEQARNISSAKLRMYIPLREKAVAAIGKLFMVKLLSRRPSMRHRLRTEYKPDVTELLPERPFLALR
jgi:hypothetical protein